MSGGVATSGAAGRSPGSPQSADVAVRVERLRKIYATKSGNIDAIGDFSITARQGEFISILGPSGCGKSTVLKIVAGLVPPTSGRVEVSGAPVERPISDLGFVFQQDLLLPWRNALKNVMLQVDIRRLDREKYLPHARRLLETAGLGGFEKKMPTELSGGMRQRVAICRALVHDPPLLLMDEPFGALDAMTRDQMGVDLQAICGTEKTVLFVTHSIEEAVFLGDRVVVMTDRPSRVRAVIDVPLERPRTVDVREQPVFVSLAADLRRLLEKGED